MNIGKIDFSIKSVSFYCLCGLWAAMTFSTALTEILFVVGLVLWFIVKFQEKSTGMSRVPKEVFWPLVGFLVLSVLSLVWSENTEASFRGIFKVLQQVALFWIVQDTMAEEGRLKQFRFVFLFVFGFTVFNGFWQYFNNADLLRNIYWEFSHAGPRISASFKTYGLLAAYMIMTIPALAGIGIYIYLTKPHHLKTALLIIMFITACVVLFWTRSRGAFLAFILGTLIALVLTRKFSWIMILMVLGLCALPFVPKKMIFHFDAEFKEQSLVERFYLWDRAVSVIKAKPLTGTGINTYASTHQKYDTTDNWRVRDYYAHNGFLQMGAETGVPCLLLFILFLFQYFKLSFRHYAALYHPYNQLILLGFIVGLLNFLVMSLVDTVMHNSQSIMIFWYLLGLQWAFQNSLEKN